LKSYQLSFGDELSGKPIYFNFMRDTLLFENSNSMLAFSGVNLSNHENIQTLPAVLKLLPREPTSGEKRLRHIAINDTLYPQARSFLIRYKALQSVVFKQGEYTPFFCRSVVRVFIKDLE
jgi:hypothetical protein